MGFPSDFSNRKRVLCSVAQAVPIYKLCLGAIFDNTMS